MKRLLTILSFIISLTCHAQPAKFTVKSLNDAQRPSKIADKYIKDTIYITADTVFTPVALYLMTCDTCKPISHSAYKVGIYWAHNYAKVLIDPKTQKHMLRDRWGTFEVTGRPSFVKYVDRNKHDFPKEYFIIKEL